MFTCLGEQEWHSGKSAPLPMCPGFDSQTQIICGLSLLLVLLLAPLGFFSRFSSFPPSTKINSFKFYFNLETVDEEPLRGNATASFHYLFIIYYLFPCRDAKGGDLSNQTSKMLYSCPATVNIMSSKELLNQSNCWKLFVLF